MTELLNKLERINQQIDAARQTINDLGADGGGWPETNLENLQRTRQYLMDKIRNGGVHE